MASCSLFWMSPFTCRLKRSATRQSRMSASGPSASSRPSWRCSSSMRARRRSWPGGTRQRVLLHPRPRKPCRDDSGAQLLVPQPTRAPLHRAGRADAGPRRARVVRRLVGHPEYLAATLHIAIATTLAGHCGMFAVTLRDKKLIGQGGEMAIAGLTNIASLAYIIFLWVQFGSPGC